MASGRTPPIDGPGRAVRLAAGLLAAVLLTAAGEVAEGPAEAVSGESLIVGGRLFCLQGIDAPEQGQTCRNSTGKEYNCGEVSRTALIDLVIGARVRCVASGPLRQGCQMARCGVDGYDLSQGMVYTGWALADPQSGGRYRGLQEEARGDKRGLWRGRSFQTPWEWRANR